MLTKQQKNKYSLITRNLKLFLLFEGLLLTSTYLTYAACNRSQRTRKYLNDTPYLKFMLDFYYKTGELVGSTAVKDFDRATWEAQSKLAQKEQSNLSSKK